VFDIVDCLSLEILEWESEAKFSSLDKASIFNHFCNAFLVPIYFKVVSQFLCERWYVCYSGI
jgi:hypothetical protein